MEDDDTVTGIKTFQQTGDLCRKDMKCFTDRGGLCQKDMMCLIDRSSVSGGYEVSHR